MIWWLLAWAVVVVVMVYSAWSVGRK